ncbi:MAG: hypothetical protein KJO11_11235 [Gemmatimonadetes bacterium]|nr:hypothetical protein [Gemmatimonadota bacterium]MBT8405013.1 hypothetical protein [Gemmatimonadota bacterium]
MTDDPEDRPIDGLHDLDFEPDPAFQEAVRRGIDRRITVGELLRLSTLALVHVVREWLSLLSSSPTRTTPPEEE